MLNMFSKNKYCFHIAHILVVSFFMCHGLAIAFETSHTDSNKIIELLKSDLFEEQYEGLQLANSRNFEMTSEAIDAILKVAQSSQEKPLWRFKGEAGEIFISELDVLLGRTRDKRAISYLLGCGILAGRSLAAIGEPAITPLIEEMHSEDIHTRKSALETLGGYLEIRIKEEKLTVHEKSKIKEALLKELTNPRNQHIEESEFLPNNKYKVYKYKIMDLGSIRLLIVRHLGVLASIGEKDIIKHIKKVATTDPYAKNFSKDKNYKGPK